MIKKFKKGEKMDSLNYLSKLGGNYESSHMHKIRATGSFKD